MPGIERDGEELPRLSPGVGCDSTAQGDKVRVLRSKIDRQNYRSHCYCNSSIDRYVRLSLLCEHGPIALLSNINKVPSHFANDLIMLCISHAH